MPILVEVRPNAHGSLDLVHDQLENGRRFRELNIVDDVTRECLAAVPDTSISGLRVVRELSGVITWRGKPGMIVSDNGTELISNAVLKWTQDQRITGLCDPALNLAYEQIEIVTEEGGAGIGLAGFGGDLGNKLLVHMAALGGIAEDLS